MRTVPARHPWEIPQPSHVLIASALARARPIAVAAEPRRLDGLSDSEVATRYAALVTAITGREDRPAGAMSLEELEAEPSDREFSAWETLVMRTGAADDPAVIELARTVWEALGPNEYAVHLRSRPRTYRGFLEGRAWLNFGALSVLALGLAAAEVQRRWGVPWWLWLPVMAAWPAVVLWLFLRRYGKRKRRGGKELPHF